MTTRPHGALEHPTASDARRRRKGSTPARVRLALAIALLAPPILEAAPWVVITEIHYHPPGTDALEFIEILNREPPRVDLTDWRLDGEVEFFFPQDTMLLPGERLVIARDPKALRDHYPGVGRVLGPYSGKLDNDGGRLTLRNPAGAIACEVRYGRDGRWPTPPDGSGHTLSLRSPYFDPAAPESWTSSPFVGGTPGTPNASPPPRGELLVRKGDVWKFRAGRAPMPPDWHAPDHDDAGWESGPSGFGYDDGDDATVFPDMEDNYASVFVRRRVEIPDPTALEELVLLVDYDDGFVAYLNGREVARANIGQPGVPVAFNEFANGNHDAGGAVEFPLGTASELVADGRLRAGTNVLAVQIHNNQISSSDLTLIVELESRRLSDAGSAGRPPLINEVLFVPGGGEAGTAEFVEIFNPGPVALDLGGHFLSDDPMNLKKVRLPATTVGPGGFAVLSARDLGARLAPVEGELFVALTTPDGRRVLDALRLELAEAPGPGAADWGAADRGAAKASRPAASLGRYPDASSDIVVLSMPTPGAENTARATTDIVINEIMYNPITESADDEFIELYNRGSQTVPLGGYTLRGGVRFQFETGARIAPHSYLVIAKNPESLKAKYGLEASGVVGPFEGRLANQGETLTLRDPGGIVADRVGFADRAPWPRWADGLGSSLELVHPDLDNSLGAAWEASDDRAKAEWQTLSYTKPHRYVMHGVQQEFQMMLLADGECFIDDLSVGAPSNLIPGGDFSDGREWLGMGTHERSHTVPAGGDRGPAGDTECYHLIADGRGNPRGNYAALPVRRRMSSGAGYRVELRAKWQRGSPLLLTRMAGQSLAQLHRLKVPARLGSPGARNTVYREGAAPAVGMPEQHPVAPTVAEEVTFTVPITALGNAARAQLHFRHEDDRAWRSVPLTARSKLRNEHGTPLWSAAIPPLPEGRVEFFIEARDGQDRLGTYPPRALDDRGRPVHVALYGVGIVPHSVLPSLALLVSDQEWDALRSRPTLSNRMATGTLVFGSERIFHGVQLRPRGSPFTRRGERNWRIVFGADTLDGRHSLTIDAQPNRGLGERLTFWLIDALQTANSRQQFVYFSVHGESGSIRRGDGERGVYEDVEKIDGGYLDRWFGSPPSVAGDSPYAASDAPDGLLHKVDDYWELTRHGDRHYQEAFFQFRSTDPEDYRWNFPPRLDDASENFAPFIELIRFLDPGRTPDDEFVARARELIAVDQWIRVLAARALSGDWDTMGGTRGKNAFVYLSPVDGLWYLLPWDADLAWGRSYHQISSRKFRSVTRLLESPLHRRLFHGHLEYLVLRKLDRGHFDQVLEDLGKRSGKSTQRYAEFASGHREMVLYDSRRFSRSDFRVREARRIERAGAPDLVRVRGVAPVLVRRLLLDGIEGDVTLEGRDGWTAEFPVGPGGGELKIEALDLGGYLVDASTVRVEAREGAPPLPDGRRPVEGKAGEASVTRAVAREDRAVAEPASTRAGPLAPIRRREPRRFAATEPVSRPAVTTTRATRSPTERQTVRTRPQPRRPVNWVPPPRVPQPRRTRSMPIGPVLIIAGLTALTVLAVRRRRRRVARRPAPRTVGSSWRFDEIAGGAVSSPASSSPASPVPRDGTGASRSTAPVPPPAVLGQAAPPPPDSPAGRPPVPAPADPPAAAPRWTASQAPSPPAAPRTGRDRLASPVASALRSLASRDFEQADQALRFLWATGASDIAALIAALVDRRSTPILELDMTDDDGVRVVAACGESGVEVRDIAELLLGSAIGTPAVDHPTQEDWVAHWQATLRGS